jgi:hypothetical protein
MESLELEVYSQASNAAVVRVPGRRFPGVVVQGDTLCSLQQRAEYVAERLKSGHALEAAEVAGDLASSLDALLLHYEVVLGEHGIPLPYDATPRHLR